VSYVLERTESHNGITILTTNANEDVDPDVRWRVKTLVRFLLPPR